MAGSPKDRLAQVKRVHRQFLYLDGDEVLSSLASLRGGDVKEVVETSLKAAGGNAGIKFSLLGAGLNFGGNGRREIKRQVALRQTISSAVTVLLDQLYDQDGVGRLTNASQLRPEHENLVVQFEAPIQLGEEWRPVEPRLPLRQRLFIRSPFEQRARFLADLTDDRILATAQIGQPPANGALLRLREKYVLVGQADDFGRRSTVVGQVEAVAADNERLEVGRDDSGEFVRLVADDHPGSGHDEPRAPGEGGGLRRADEKVVVRPFCIFR